jgi:CheY-like chemotaxis protein
MTSPFGRLLIVDDDEAVLEVLAEYFGGQGHAVETALSGDAALAAFTRARPDLVLLDVRMPGMDGVQVLRQLRALTTAVPIVMVTANEDLAVARLTLKLGAFDYVPKPFDFGYLDRVVTAALARAGQREDHAAPAAGAGSRGAAALPDDPFRELATAVFRVTRALPAQGRSLAGRLEDAALAAAVGARSGESWASRRGLAQLGVLVDVGLSLGDLRDADREVLVAALDAARAGLAPER